MFTVEKKYRESDNHITYSLYHDTLKTGYCCGYHGYADLNESQYKALRHIADLKYISLNGRIDSNHNVTIKFEITEDQVHEAGIMFILNKDKYWGTIDKWNGTNQFHDTVDVFTMIEALKDRPIAKNEEEFDRLYKHLKL